MIHDAKVEITCDGENCDEFIEVGLSYKYTDYSGENGYYEFDEKNVISEIAGDGWIALWEEHFCENCAAEIS